MSEPIKIDIWSDIACPWCYIGKRKLETALEAFADSEHALDVQIEYHSFELMPEATNDYTGTAVEFVASLKHLSHGAVRDMLADVTARAAEVGLDFDYDHLRNANTTKALELLHYASAHGVQPEMAELLFRAHFTEARHVGRVDELVAIAAEVGLDETDVRRSLEVGEYADAVRSDIDDARRIGIQGVPFYVFDGRYAVSGAQDPTVFASVLKRAAVDRAAVPA